MRVKVLVSMVTLEEVYTPGQEYEMDDLDAVRHAAAGHVEIVGTPETPKPPPQQTTRIPGGNPRVETASRKPPRR